MNNKEGLHKRANYPSKRKTTSSLYKKYIFFVLVVGSGGSLSSLQKLLAENRYNGLPFLGSKQR